VKYINGISRGTKFPWSGTGCEGAWYKGQVARDRITWTSRHGARRGGGGVIVGNTCQRANWHSLRNQERSCHGTHYPEEIVIKHNITGELSWWAISGGGCQGGTQQQRRLVVEITYSWTRRHCARYQERVSVGQDVRDERSWGKLAIIGLVFEWRYVR
jgi:hypothetical protein